MKKIPKQEYTIKFKEQAVKQVEMGKSISLVAKELVNRPGISGDKMI